tara:strand:- start:78 stop:359 length:282 start_codon:yes stop_codon:yes gene_type:complete
VAKLGVLGQFRVGEHGVGRLQTGDVPFLHIVMVAELIRELEHTVHGVDVFRVPFGEVAVEVGGVVKHGDHAGKDPQFRVHFQANACHIPRVKA